MNLPIMLASGKLYAYYTGSAVLIQTDFRLSISYDWAYYMSVSVPETYSGSLCGLGGDFNGIPYDDLRTPNGTLVQDAVDFGDSWKDASSSFHCTAVGHISTCSETELAQYRSHIYCGIIGDESGPFKDCIDPADSQIYMESCVRDINDMFYLLPVHLKNQGIAIYQHGFYAIVKADFGLTVSYDLVHSLFITLSPKYQDQVCGLCGSFHGAAAADSMAQDAYTVKHHLDHIRDWILPAINLGSTSSTAFGQKEHLVQSKSRCWIIQNPEGPFASCHSIVDPEPYLTNCIFDLYTSSGDIEILCSSIQTYVAACQRANVTLWPWRTEFFCAAECPSRSHYELCKPSCQDLCVGSTFKHLCSSLCSEGCVCDDGYLWNGDECVRPELCGCEYNGRYYNVGDLLWLSDCTQRCSCGAFSTFRCIPASCNHGQRCALKEGKLGCINQLATCTISGDPHYFTFDGAVVHFQGTCAYEISKTSDSVADFSFRVVAANKNFQSPRVSFLYRVEIWLSSKQFNSHVVLEQGKDVQVDGRQTLLPTELKHLANITQRKNVVTLRAHPSLEIQYNGRHALFVRVGPEYWGKLRGMCGNFNGIHGDDKVLPDGEKAMNDSQFGNAWIAGTERYTNSFSKCLPALFRCLNDVKTSEPCINLQEFEEMCGILRNHSGPFSECHWHEDPAPYYESCIYDLCYYGTGDRMLCAAIEAYEEMCEIVGVNVPNWRKELGCGEQGVYFIIGLYCTPVACKCVAAQLVMCKGIVHSLNNNSCPANAYYDYCGTACPATCTDITAPTNCSKPCVAGCFCQQGHVLNADVCIPLEECGCRMNGHNYQVGEEVILTDTCSKRCSCKQPSHPMECQDHACGPLEICKVMGGIRSCYPVTYGTMWAFGYLHYITFDGVTFDYQGPCRYLLSKFCGPPNNLPAFSLWVSNEHKGSIAVSGIKLIELDVYGERITVVGGQEGKVQVRGSFYKLWRTES
ncbi:hypothetical protein JD844_005638 [Phrynosoma platyrhinos]|uniref:VWFD domain-containing protein n=1 Tax=Phrynosoma platyrhinos TaxID=52577 RepID=A0ABQ7TNF7_PHRPL|nr:hypothetical protein JD844_005638 [Phrynosoma platyrhinos]